jgi:glutathione synthase/RimK-type ligase-like ATP-grasp enzyme
VAWAAGVPRLANAAEIVAWNTDKRYLTDLATAGVPIVPTEWIGESDVWQLPDGGEWVIKPAVSAGSRDTGRYRLDDAEHRQLATGHVARLQATGRLVMVQPYLPMVDTHGETALLYLDGEFSHAIRKGPMLRGPDMGVEGLFQPEAITAREPTPAEHTVAAKALAALPDAVAMAAREHGLLYARVDLIAGSDGTPVVVELELTEPSLFLGTAGGAARRFAVAIRARLDSAR